MTRKPSIFHRLAQVLMDDDWTWRTLAAIVLAVAAALGGVAGCVLVGSVLVSVSPWLLAIVAPFVWWMLARLVTRDHASCAGTEELLMPTDRDQTKVAPADRVKEAERGQQWEPTAALPPVFDRIEPQTPLRRVP